MSGFVESYRSGLRGLDRRVYAVVTITLLAIAARMSVYTFLGIYFTRDAGIPLALVGVAYLAENVVRGLVAPFGGALSDRIGRRPVIAGSAMLCVAIMPLFLLVHDAWQLLAWAILLGAAQAGVWPASSALLLDLTPPEKRRSVLGLNYTAISVGYTLGVAPAGFLAERGFDALALASAGVFAIAAAIALVGLRGLPRIERDGRRTSVLADISHAPRDRGFALLAMLAFVFPLGIGLVSSVAPLYAQEGGLDEGRIGLALAVNGPLLAIFSIPVATMLERHGPYRHLVHAAIFIALSYLALVVSSGFGALIVTSVVFTAGELIFSSALPAAVGALAPAGLRGAYQGAWGFVHSASYGLSIFLTGLVSPAIGWRNTWIAWMTLTAIAALGLAIARPAFRRIADERNGPITAEAGAREDARSVQ